MGRIMVIVCSLDLYTPVEVTQPQHHFFVLLPLLCESFVYNSCDISFDI